MSILFLSEFKTNECENAYVALHELLELRLTDQVEINAIVNKNFNKISFKTAEMSKNDS